MAKAVVREAYQARRSPSFATILGALFPPLGALYNANLTWSILLLAVEVWTDAMYFEHGALLPRLLFGIFGAWLARTMANRFNDTVLTSALNEVR